MIPFIVEPFFLLSFFCVSVVPLGPFLSAVLRSLMATVRRFGSCSSCQLRNSAWNGNRSGTIRKSRSTVTEWLLGSRIKAQGEEEEEEVVVGGWRRGSRGAKAPLQAGVCVYQSVFVCNVVNTHCVHSPQEPSSGVHYILAPHWLALHSPVPRFRAFVLRWLLKLSTVVMVMLCRIVSNYMGMLCRIV